MAFAFLRRLAVAAVLSAAALAAHGALAAGAATAPEPDRTIDMATVLKPGPLPELAMGDASGVPVVEYGSLTCPHCAAFSRETFPQLKKEYIDTGKVKFIFREFPLDIKAAAGSMLARCVGKDDPNKYFAVVDILFKTQESWIPNDTVAALRRIGRQAGFSDQATDACLANQATLDGIKATQEHAADKLKVNSTPTFFVNGTLLKGGAEIAEFRKVIDPLLKS